MNGSDRRTARGSSGVTALVVILSTAVPLAGAATAATPVAPAYDQTVLTAAGGDSIGFGESVAILSGDRIVVGAPVAGLVGGNATGAIYDFAPDGAGGYDQRRIVSSDIEVGDAFGTAVAASGDTLVVGAPGDDDVADRAGAVYVYVPDGAGGRSETKLTASDGIAADRFGDSVAISGDVIVVGTDPDDDVGFVPGAAYVYRPDGAGGYTETKLTASDGETSDLFGTAVAISGDTIVVGASGDDDRGVAAGAAYVYRPDGAGGYTETKLTGVARDGDRLGWSVAIDGDTIAVGAPLERVVNGPGAVYVFTPNATGGYGLARLAASDSGLGDWFGVSVAVRDGTVVVGSDRNDNANGSGAGAAYVYAPAGSGGGYTETKLLAANGSPGSFFGRSVAIAPGRIAVGGPNLLTQGSASVFAPAAPPPVVIPGAATVTEGDVGTQLLSVPVSLSAPSDQVIAVEWTTIFEPTWGSLAARPDEDYEATSGTVTFAPGDTEQTVAIPVVGDLVAEDPELVVVSFRRPANARLGGFFGLGFGGITDNDNPS